MLADMQRVWGEAEAPGGSGDGVYYYNVGTGECAWQLPSSCAFTGTIPALAAQGCSPALTAQGRYNYVQRFLYIGRIPIYNYIRDAERP
jgi:hypothetical protein